ncbi:MAG: hypothetical protein ACYDCJ_06880 [Gammaproteobacteria bacterium]
MNKLLIISAACVGYLALAACTPQEMREYLPPALQTQPAVQTAEQVAAQTVTPPNSATQLEVSNLINAQIQTLQGQMQAQVQSAMPTIARMVSTFACIRKGTSTDQVVADVNHFTMVGHPTYYSWNVLEPAGYMPSHMGTGCLAVPQIGNWSMPTLNTLTFTVRYQAQDSGETIDATYELLLNENQWYLVGPGN